MYGCHRWSPIPSVAPQALWPQMVPLKISLEMMSHSSYEVDLANVDCVIIIFHYALLYAVARRPSVDTHTARGYN